MELYNDDCLNKLKDFKKHSIDCVIVDLPYGQTDCKWDCKIDLNKMWIELKRICKPCANILFFTTTKFGVELINSNSRAFCYDLVWEKSKKLGFLNSKKAPLRKHELIYLFNNLGNDDIDISRNEELREYAGKIKKYINTPISKINKIIGSQGLDHFFRISSSQFGIPIENNYKKLTDHFKLDELDYYLPYEELKKRFDKGNKRIYNPQMEKGKPYTQKTKGDIIGVYGLKRSKLIENKGTRYPHSILRFNNPHKTVHNTQKPVKLIEWLISSYSNEGDVILDFTMGSGSTGVACKNTNRYFIGIEKDEDIFKIAEKRLNQEILKN